ncbi:MAG: response regulator [Prolixibacteraceae bacterium]|jgi:DNA-binding NarL/FixJ family response regulator
MSVKRKILVIDDDQLIGLTVKSILSFNGYEVCTADNGASGIEKIFEYNPDLILCDVRMNPIDGYKVLKILKDNTFNHKIPFVFISGNSSIGEVRFGMELGADDYLVKPIKTDELITSVENQFKKYNSLLEIGNKRFRALFELSPNYIFIFDGSCLFEVNSSFVEFFRIDSQSITTHTIEEILDPISYESIKDKIQRCKMGILEKFNEFVTVILSDGSKLDMAIYVSRSEKNVGYSLLLGLLIPPNTLGLQFDHNKLLKELLLSLREENITVSNQLTQRLSHVIDTVVYSRKIDLNNFFSVRELDVLQLSISGLSIKQISDKLQISDRTVERHRAHLMEKTNANSMVEVIVFAIKNDLIEL